MPRSFMQFNITGIDAVRLTLKLIEKDINEKKKPYKRALAILDRWVQENFKTEGGKVGGWAPLAVSTFYGGIKGKHVTRTGISAEMKRHILNRKILQQKGFLKRNWKHIVTLDECALVSTAAGGKNNYLYGSVHNTGTNKAGRNKKTVIPQRRILPKDEEIWPKLMKCFDEHIAEALTKAKGL